MLAIYRHLHLFLCLVHVTVGFPDRYLQQAGLGKGSPYENRDVRQPQQIKVDRAFNAEISDLGHYANDPPQASRSSSSQAPMNVAPISQRLDNRRTTSSQAPVQVLSDLVAQRPGNPASSSSRAPLNLFSATVTRSADYRRSSSSQPPVNKLFSIPVAQRPISRISSSTHSPGNALPDQISQQPENRRPSSREGPAAKPTSQVFLLEDKQGIIGSVEEAILPAEGDRLAAEDKEYIQIPVGESSSEYGESNAVVAQEDYIDDDGYQLSRGRGVLPAAGALVEDNAHPLNDGEGGGGGVLLRHLLSLSADGNQLQSHSKNNEMEPSGQGRRARDSEDYGRYGDWNAYDAFPEEYEWEPLDSGNNNNASESIIFPDDFDESSSLEEAISQLEGVRNQTTHNNETAGHYFDDEMPSAEGNASRFRGGNSSWGEGSSAESWSGDGMVGEPESVVDMIQHTNTSAEDTASIEGSGSGGESSGGGGNTISESGSGSGSGSGLSEVNGEFFGSGDEGDDCGGTSGGGSGEMVTGNEEDGSGGGSGSGEQKDGLTLMCADMSTAECLQSIRNKMHEIAEKLLAMKKAD